MSVTADVVSRFRIDDLVLRIKQDCNRDKWDEDRYEPFFDTLCEGREYQKSAIRTVLKYLLSGEYSSLRQLALENWHINPVLQEKYGTFANFERNLQLPEQLSASVDLATGTGKTFVIYGVAMVLLAEGAADSVLVLCPSTTIENGILGTFRRLASNADLSDSLPGDAVVRVPHIQQADSSILAGSICVENRDAIYSHVGSSIRSGLLGKGAKVAILNDEAHHVANDPLGKTKKWKEFLADPEYGFKMVVGFSGTCYVDNEYFSDVLYRFSLRRAIEERFVKTVKFLKEIERTGEVDEDWQHRINMHEKKRTELRPRNIRPLSVIVTPTIERCKAVAEELRVQLRQRCELGEQETADRVLVVYNNAPDVARLYDLDAPESVVEWVVSVSMLTEGWDVKRVFQIIPHEERAFNSRLLIAQVLGRGLRIPNTWPVNAPQPEVTVVNHASWAPAIAQLVAEILELDRSITARIIPDSPYHFELHNLKYKVNTKSEERTRKAPFGVLTGSIDIPTEAQSVAVTAGFVSATDPTKTDTWTSVVQREMDTPENVARQMHNILVKLDMENAAFGLGEATSYAIDYPYERLLGIVRTSLNGQEYCTESNKQKFLQALGTLRRRTTKIVRYELDPEKLVTLSTRDRPAESASATQLSRDRVAFIPHGAEVYVDEEQRQFLAEVTEPDSQYRSFPITNRYDLKSPVSMVFTDANPERKFVKELLTPANAKAIDAWVKSTSVSFYSIDYWWKKGTHPKKGSFNPDFFLKIGELRVVVEVKGEDEQSDPAPESIKKNQFAVAHFARVNEELAVSGSPVRYIFHFLSPRDYPDFFDALRNGRIATYRSHLDVELSAAVVDGVEA